MMCFLACREAVRAMKNGGCIVNVVVCPVVQLTVGMIAYVIVKVGVVVLM